MVDNIYKCKTLSLNGVIAWDIEIYGLIVNICGLCKVAVYSEFN